MYGDAADLIAHDLAFAGVESAADLKAEIANRIRDRTGASNGARRTIKGGKESVPRGVDFAASELNEHTPNDGIVVVEKIVPTPVTECDGLFGRTNDVGEQHCSEYPVGLCYGTDAGEKLRECRF